MTTAARAPIVSLDHLLTRKAALLVRVPAGEDDDGDFAYDVVRRDVPIEIQTSGSSEFAEGGILSSRWRVWLAADVELSGWDAIELNGVVYELDGDPAQMWSPLTRSVHHVECEVVGTR